jgi:hypothetical protein
MNTPIIARDLTKQAPHSPREHLAADDRETFRRKSLQHFLL